jgi:predicted phosphate transport protein (TIGR00153 family)
MHNLHEPAKGTTMVRLMPKDEKFQELFVDYARTTLDAARKLEDMIVTYDRLDERVAEIRALEHHGDEIDTEVEVRLDRSFITPFDREDIHELVSRMDDVLDRIQEVAETFVIYDVKEPTDDARRMAGILSAQAGQLNEAMGKLDGLKNMESNLKAVHDLENEADGLSRAAVARLFRGGHEAIEVIKWRDIYTAMENMIDAAEDAGEVLERIVAKNA